MRIALTRPLFDWAALEDRIRGFGGHEPILTL